MSPVYSDGFTMLLCCTVSQHTRTDKNKYQFQKKDSLYFIVLSGTCFKRPFITGLFPSSFEFDINYTNDTHIQNKV